MRSLASKLKPLVRTHLLGGKAAPTTKTRGENLAAATGDDRPPPPLRVKKQKTVTQSAEALVKKAILKIGVADGLEGSLQRSGMCLNCSLALHVTGLEVSSDCDASLQLVVCGWDLFVAELTLMFATKGPQHG